MVSKRSPTYYEYMLEAELKITLKSFKHILIEIMGNMETHGHIHP
jgi:hypothetical protein